VTSYGLTVHRVAWGLLVALFAFVVPRAEAIFADFDSPLPRLTVLVIRASHWVVPFASLVLGLLGADWLIMNARSERDGAGLVRAWSVLMFALPLLLIALTLTALVLPLLSIMTTLSG
jgi:type II secretory pathway component PulF